jgi:hypothetical protein
MLFAGGRRTVTTWLRAAGVSDDYQDYYYFLVGVGRKSESIATQLLGLVLCVLPLPERLLLVLDDSPTKRYGPQVEGADVHHIPTPGPADQPFLYGHVWVTISLALRHPRWGSLALPLRALLYVHQRTIATIPRHRRWTRFATKLQLAARLVEWIVPLLKQAEKTVWLVVDGGYTKRPFLRRALKIRRKRSRRSRNRSRHLHRYRLTKSSMHAFNRASSSTPPSCSAHSIQCPRPCSPLRMQASLWQSSAVCRISKQSSRNSEKVCAKAKLSMSQSMKTAVQNGSLSCFLIDKGEQSGSKSSV